MSCTGLGQAVLGCGAVRGSADQWFCVVIMSTWPPRDQSRGSELGPEDPGRIPDTKSELAGKVSLTRNIIALEVRLTKQLYSQDVEKSNKCIVAIGNGRPAYAMKPTFP